MLIVNGDRVLVERDGVQEQTAAGLLLAPGAQDKPTTGTVRGVGGQVTLYRPGARVVFAAWSGMIYLAEGREWFVLREGEIVGELDGQPAPETA